MQTFGLADIGKRHPMVGLLVAQFFGAFNDNAWKQIVVVLAIAAATAQLDPSDPVFETTTQKQVVVAQVVLVLPLMLISLPAAVLADRMSKRSLIVAMKMLELVLMSAATVVLYLNPQGAVWSLVILGLMGAQSALFSPAKYGILPEIFPHNRLSWANGVLEMWSNFAIIGGMVAGPALVWATTGKADVSQIWWLKDIPLIAITLQWASVRVWLAALLLTGLSAVGLVASLMVPVVPPARTSGDTLGAFSEAWRAIRGDRILWLAFVGQILFWSIASLIPVAAFAYVSAKLQLQTFLTGVPLAALGIGIGVGSILAGKLSADKVEYGLLPLGTLGLALLSILFGIWGPGVAGTITLMALLGVFSGFIVVPLNALLQWRSPAGNRGTVIALTNIFVFGGMFGGSLVGYLLAELQVSPQGTFLVAALILVASFVWALSLVPDAFLRFVLFLLAHTIYRFKRIDPENVPQQGGALLVPNHVSLVDGLLLLATVDRPIRFLVYSKFFEQPVIGFFLRALKAIPISSSGGPRVILRAFRDAGRYLDEGHLVCIFAEGQITRTGTLQPFQRGLERIVKGRSAPIIPVYLDRAIGSIFAYTNHRRIPQRLPFPVTIAFGEPLPTSTPIAEVRQAVVELGYTAWMRRRDDAETLHRGFVRRCRRHPFRLAFADPLTPKLGGWSSLAAVIALAAKLQSSWKDQQTVGILLPPSAAGALVNIAASLAGKTSVNLNYTAGKSGLTSAARQAQLSTVVTNKLFLQKAKVELPENVQPIWIDEVRNSISMKEKILAALLATFAPVRVLERRAGHVEDRTPDDVATIIFSSGSTGEPKGVELTHFNVASNVEQVTQVFRVLPNDRVMGVLPFFHSFGYLVLWLASNEGLGTCFHVSPLEAPVIGAMVERYQATVLLATPTFLQLYMRRCTPAQFGSLRLVIAGAERLPERLRDTFEDTFGLRPLEGYGATECSPVIAVSTTDERGPGFFQPGSRRGYVGQPLPGMVARIVDPETSEPQPRNAPGMLHVKGPNVMKGYLNKPQLTEEVLLDGGWYVTGDIAEMDEDNFLKITGRLSRFSKIGGEMVPHGKVEEALHDVTGSSQQVFAVTSVEDERKGERLAVLHTLDPKQIPEIVDKLSATGLPNLFIPRPDQFHHVDELPLLGSGKLDLRAAKKIAQEKMNKGK